MFPTVNVKLSGLNPDARYSLFVKFVPVDGFKYKWNKERCAWEAACLNSQNETFDHLHWMSPSTGREWMNYRIDFDQVFMTNSRETAVAKRYVSNF